MSPGEANGTSLPLLSFRGSIIMRDYLLASALLLIPNGIRAASLSLPEPKPVPAQAEVSAVEYPVKLTLNVYRTDLKLQDDFKIVMDDDKLHREHPGPDEQIDWVKVDAEMGRYLRRIPTKVAEPLWVKVRLTNLGQKPMFVLDDLFTGPMDFQQIHESAGSSNITIVITGPDGKRVPWQSTKEISGMQCPENDPSSREYRPVPKPRQDPEERIQMEIWKKEGKSAAKISDLLNKQHSVKKEREQAGAKHPIAKLEQGESIVSRPWRFRGKCQGDSDRLPAQVGDYMELWNFHLDTPGVYTIKAEYYGDPYARSDGKKVRFGTRPIKVKVRP